jgi:hypothetical protein
MPPEAKHEILFDDPHELPLVIGVTGHRDLVPTETDRIRVRVRSLLIDLDRRYPERRLRVMSALAEGADRIVAEVAVQLGIQLVVPLPMPKATYAEDFDKPESLEEFESLIARASDVFELPLARGGAAAQSASSQHEHGRQYAQLGVFLCAHCHILLALWDGKPGTELGGTGQVVKFHHDDIMPGYTAKSVASQQMLVDDESDLVYHIVCSRDRENGAPANGLKPGDCWWFTKDRKNPRSKELPFQHQLIFERSSEFSLDTLRFADQIEAEKYPLYDERDRDRLPAGIEEINRLFCIADWLAIHYQKKTLRTLRAGHILAFLMGLMFILFSDLEQSVNDLACVAADEQVSMMAPLSGAQCSDFNARLTNTLDKLDKCIDAAISPPKESVLNQTCQAYQSQFGNLQSVVASFTLAGQDPANRIGEAQARMIVIDNVFTNLFFPSIPDGGFTNLSRN